MTLLDRLGWRRRLPLRILDIPAPPDAVIYAIGDVHGCLDLLVELERAIAHDIPPGRDVHLVMLGDFIDRGPASAAVIDHLLGKPPFSGQRHCVAGNHERWMMRFLADPAGYQGWLFEGGRETLRSYGIDDSALARTPPTGRRYRELLEAHVPREHMAFLSGLPDRVTWDCFAFAHYPDAALGQALGEAGGYLVHGHLIVPSPTIAEGSINIDTGAYATNRLTAVRMMRGQPPIFLEASRQRLAGRYAEATDLPHRA